MFLPLFGCAGFGFAALPHFVHRGSQIAKTLTSFRVLPFGRPVIPLTGLDEFASDIESCKHVSASLGSFVIPTPKAEESSQSFICNLKRFFIRGSQIAKTLTSFRVLPFGLA